MILDIFFTLFHTLITLFNLTGWIPKKTRNLHLISLGLTWFSWIGLGYFYGWGYCFCTDWHYQVLLNRGFEHLPHSYITFLIQRSFGLNLDDEMVILWTAGVFILVTFISLGFYIKSVRAKINTGDPAERKALR